jgi:hypothetical protein
MTTDSEPQKYIYAVKKNELFLAIICQDGMNRSSGHGRTQKAKNRRKYRSTRTLRLPVILSRAPLMLACVSYRAFPNDVADIRGLHPTSSALKG